jgi:hypothetical protein
MSATRDTSQKFKFLYSNLHTIYTKEKRQGFVALVKEQPKLPADTLRLQMMKLNELHQELNKVLAELKGSEE